MAQPTPSSVKVFGINLGKTNGLSSLASPGGSGFAAGGPFPCDPGGVVVESWDLEELLLGTGDPSTPFETHLDPEGLGAPGSRGGGGGMMACVTGTELLDWLELMGSLC
eukprot:1242534-Amphidinium_carterae.4